GSRRRPDQRHLGLPRESRPRTRPGTQQPVRGLRHRQLVHADRPVPRPRLHRRRRAVRRPSPPGIVRHRRPRHGRHVPVDGGQSRVLHRGAHADGVRQQGHGRRRNLRPDESQPAHLFEERRAMNRTDATTAKASLALAVVAAMLGACRADSAPEATASEESAEIIPHIITLPMQRGPMADYGATPWYTDRIALGKSPMRLALDSGASFFWATSDLCTTQACNAHARVDTGQPGFVWLDKTPTTRSFGPWGNMTTWTGAVPLYIDGGPWQAIPFFASVDYSGAKFQYLTWGGGVGLPSESADVTPGSGFLIEMLYFKGGIPSPEFSMLTEPWTGTGFTWLGGRGDPTYFDPRSEVQLQPKKAAIGYLWGTNLYSVRLGGTPLPPLAGQTFFLDSGSSRFKGDAQYVYPIMQPLSQLRDAQGNLIFTPTYDDAGNWVGLYYTNGRPSDYPNLPDLTL